MRGVEQWLSQVGLAQYASVFAEHDIDGEVLLDLTDSDLEKLGVTLGHRKKLLKAIAALDSDQRSTPAARRHCDVPPLARPPGDAEAERRHLTVMFCDLAGSTGLSQRLDPEDLRAVISACQSAWRQAIERYDGFVARYMGDGILAYFGYPLAHEDDAERAVRAGIGIVETMDKLNAGVAKEKGIDLAVRVGIGTGPVVAGDLIGEGASQETPVIGETPNLAARLQGVAPSNAVVVAPDTYRLTTGTFRYRSLGNRRLKGIARPVELWQALGEGTARSRFEALHGRRLTRLVGRDEELAFLVRGWEHAKESEGQVVLISGEPGIGKSRLCESLRARIAEQAHFRLAYQCSPFHIDSAFHPVINQLERAAGIEARSTLEEKRDRLETLMGASGDAGESDVALFAALLRVPLAQCFPAIGIDTHGHEGRTFDTGVHQVESHARKHKEQTLRALVNRVESLSAQCPVLVIFEDLHWADPSTLELLDRLVERVEQLPVLMLLTFRPEFRPTWTGQGYVTPLTLKRISKRESRALLDAVAGARSIPEELANEVVAKTDGVPLFVEEVTRMLLEASSSNGGTVPGNARVAVPTTLQDSLVARLDRLAVGKHVAQTGAAIGREFTEELLESVSELERSELERALAELVESGLLFRRGSSLGATYIFKHALLQEASYNSLLLAKRKPLHGRIAKALQKQSPAQPAILARHWEGAGNLEMALHCRLEAAKEATRLYALREAIAQYSLALDLLDQLPQTRDTRGRHADTALALTRVMGIGGSVSWQDEAQQRRVLRHLDKAIGTATGQRDLALLARLQAYKGRFWADEALLARAVANADASGDKAVQAETRTRYAGHLGKISRFEDSFVYTDRAIELYAELGESSLQGMALAGQGRCSRARSGRLDESLRYAHRARELAKRSEDPQITAWAAMESEPFMYKGLWKEAFDVAQQYLPLAFEIGEWLVILSASAWGAVACLKLTRRDEASRLMDAASAAVGQRVGLEQPRAYFQTVVGQVELAHGEAENALVASRESLDLAESGGCLLEQGAAHRVLGQAYALEGNRSQAKSAFRRSLEVLEGIGSRPELAQTLLAHGQFVLADDAGEGARQLNRALELFREMDAVGWIEETRTALDR